MSCVADVGGDQQRAERDEPAATRAGSVRRQQHDRGDQQAVCENTSQPRRRPRQRDSTGTSQRVDQRRPQEFQRVGRADQRQNRPMVPRSTPASRIHTSSVEPDSASGRPGRKSRGTARSARAAQIDRQRRREEGAVC